MKQKTMIILASIAFLLLMGSSMFFFFKTLNAGKNNETPKTEEQQKIDEEIENAINKNESLTDKEKEELTTEEKESIALGEEYANKQGVLTLGESHKKEYGETESNALYKQLIILSQRASYIDIVNRVDELLNKYKFTEEYNWKICNVYLDANVMINVKSNTLEGQPGYMVSNLKDPYMLLTGTLMLPEKERRAVIKEYSSLSPIFEGEVVIKETKILTHETKDKDAQGKMIIEKESSLKELYKIKFEVEKNPLIAYICKYSNGAISFKMIVADGEYDYPYKPISYWMNLDKILYGN